MYFPEDMTSEVYREPAYSARGPKDTTNASDGVNAGAVPPLLAVAKAASGYLATLSVTVA